MNWKSFLFLFCCIGLQGQSIADFESIKPIDQNTFFVFPESHTFQRIVGEGDSLTAGGVIPGNFDFTAYVPIEGSSENGYLSLNSELIFGEVHMFDVSFDPSVKLWETGYSQAVDFEAYGLVSRPCSGAVTSWGTVISCEEATGQVDTNGDGYYDVGWCMELDPVNKVIIDKLWAMGNFKHENACIHENDRTCYMGADSNPGYLYKFVADTAQNLNSGRLYVYKGSKSGPGQWLQLANETKEERNTTLDQCESLEATVFNGIEDVEIGPDGWVYLAVKGESRVYRFEDSDPIDGEEVIQMRTHVGNRSYDITHAEGVTTVDWGLGNDNMAFDGEGNLWVLQDGPTKYIWLVENGHTQSDPKVKIFGNAPIGSEPTGITFSPDYRFMFISLQNPAFSNSTSTQIDAAGEFVDFGKDVAMVIALDEDLGVNQADCSGPNIVVEQICNDDDTTVTLSGVILDGEAPFTLQGDFQIDALEQNFFELTASVNRNIAVIFVGDANGCVGRLDFEIQSCETVAVDLIRFSGEETEQGHLLSWSTASEFESAGFELMHSIDGIHFEKIGFVPSAGYSSTAQHYDFLFKGFSQGENYYRLEELEETGTRNASEIISIVSERTEEFLQIAPIPADDMIEIQFTSSDQSDSLIEIYDLFGRLIIERNISKSVGRQAVQLDISSLDAGLYLLKMQGYGNAVWLPVTP